MRTVDPLPADVRPASGPDGSGPGPGPGSIGLDASVLDASGLDASGLGASGLGASGPDPAGLESPERGRWGAGGVVDLAGVVRGSTVTYRVTQRFCYAYDGHAADLVHRLVVMPPRRHGDQTVRVTDLAVSAANARTTWQRGPDGARIATVRLREVPPELTFEVTAVLEREVGAGWPWLRATALTGRRLIDPTKLTTPDEVLVAAARSMVSEDAHLTARRFSAWVHRRIAYVPGSTSVTTTAAAAVAGGRGVCQDQAHVMLALCRAVGLPARYVSGHLVGDGPSHAWVEVIMPIRAAPAPATAPADGTGTRTGTGTGTRTGTGTGTSDWDSGAVAVAYDPCHDRLADLRYVTIAVGRDYADVAPTSGWYVGAGRGTLVTTQTVRVLGVRPPAPPATVFGPPTAVAVDSARP